jgi:hypothetical protein
MKDAACVVWQSARAPWVLLLSSGLCAASARANGDSERSIQAHLAARGARDVQEVERSFLFEGQALVHTLRFERAGCRALLAWGGLGLRDLDLGLYSRDGSALAEDRGPTPFAYARFTHKGASIRQARSSC